MDIFSDFNKIRQEGLQRMVVKLRHQVSKREINPSQACMEFFGYEKYRVEANTRGDKQQMQLDLLGDAAIRSWNEGRSGIMGFQAGHIQDRNWVDGESHLGGQWIDNSI